MRTKILVIDDEESICEILKYNLEKEGFDVDTALSAEEALEMDLPSYSLFIVDIMMDRLSGFDFAKRLKRDDEVEDIPIIFCSALSGEEDTVQGLNIGADDYITKPFKIPEVIARVHSVLRRVKRNREVVAKNVAAPAREVAQAPASYEADIVFKGLRINRNNKEVKIDGKVVSLTPIEFRILVFLAGHRNRIFSREEIINDVWDRNVVVSNRTVDTNLTRLRKKLGDYGKHIETRTGFGYGFKETP